MQLDKKVIGHEFKAFSSTAEAGKVKLFGQPVDVKARPPHKKLLAKVTRCLTDSVVQETNK